MPLKSKAQQRWMFANHPEMAKKWAHETPNMKNLPEKVKKKKKDLGGVNEIIPNIPYDYQAKLQAQLMKPIQPLGEIPAYQPPQRRNFPWQGIMQAGTVGLSAIGEMVDRGRQNQYLQSNLSTLGQRSGRPTDMDQPKMYNPYAEKGGTVNPYLMYKNLGGSLKKYPDGGLTRGLIPKPKYNFPMKPGPDGKYHDANGNMNVPTADDSTMYRIHYDQMRRNDPYALKQKGNWDYYGMPSVGPNGGPLDPNIEFGDWAQRNAYDDALKPSGVMTKEQIMAELNRPLQKPKTKVVIVNGKPRRVEI